MGKWYLYASLFIFDWIIIKVASNQDRHKSLVEFNFGPNQTTHFRVTCPWVMKISHFWTWISLKPVGQSWSNFMCSIIGVGERLLMVLGQIDLGTLDSGERSLPFGLFVLSTQHKNPLKSPGGARWLSGRVSDSGARGPGFETYRRRVVSLSKTLYSPKVLVNYPGSDGSVPTWLKNCWLGR